MSKKAAVKPWAWFVGFILLAGAVTGGIVYIANRPPAPTAAALKLAPEERAIYDFTFQFAAVGTIGNKNTQTTAVGQVVTDIEYLAHTQKQEVRATLAAQHIDLADVKVDPELSLMQNRTFLVRMSHAEGTAFDTLLVQYLKALRTRMDELKAAGHFQHGIPAKRFKEIYDQANGGLNYIGAK